MRFPVAARFRAWLRAFLIPQPIVRLAAIRIAAPLAILGFYAARLIHPQDWLSVEGFRVPLLAGKDWRQPLFLPPLPTWGAVLLCVALVVSGLLLSAGLRTKIAAAAFTFCLAYVAFADRLAAFTVTKLSVVIALALFLSPAGQARSFDAWLTRTPAGPAPSSHASWGNVRFFQCLLVVLYCTSGIAKIQGDWLGQPHVLWTHLHDSYQTWVAFFVASLLPAWMWTVFQGLVLAFEVGAPVWFALPWTRKPALLFGLGMHAFIGLCFGPVKWFALLMVVLLLACFAPPSWLHVLLPPKGSGAEESRPHLMPPK